MNYTFHHDLEREILITLGYVADLPWLLAQGYTVPLPQGIGVGAAPDDVAREVAYEFSGKAPLIARETARVQAALATHGQAIDDFLAATFTRLPVPGKIPVHFTAYGPGGSYDPDRAEILARYDHPHQPSSLHNVLHETVHIVVEAGVVRALGLSHAQKETVVHEICTGATFLAPFPPNPYHADLPAGWRELL